MQATGFGQNCSAAPFYFFACSLSWQPCAWYYQGQQVLLTVALGNPSQPGGCPRYAGRWGQTHHARVCPGEPRSEQRRRSRAGAAAVEWAAQARLPERMELGAGQAADAPHGPWLWAQGTRWRQGKLRSSRELLRYLSSEQWETKATAALCQRTWIRVMHLYTVWPSRSSQPILCGSRSPVSLAPETKVGKATASLHQLKSFIPIHLGLFFFSFFPVTVLQQWPRGTAGLNHFGKRGQG